MRETVFGEPSGRAIVYVIRSPKKTPRSVPPAAMCRQRDARCMALRCLEETGGVPERILVLVGFEDLMAVAPADRLHLAQPLAGDGRHHTGGVRAVMRGREAISPSWKTALISCKRNQALVVVFRLGVEDRAELSLAGPLPACNDLGPVVAGLRHHVL